MQMPRQNARHKSDHLELGIWKSMRAFAAGLPGCWNLLPAANPPFFAMSQASRVVPCPWAAKREKVRICTFPLRIMHRRL